MDKEMTSISNNSFGAELTQVAWVVKDIKAAEKFFRDVFHITNFSKPEIIRLAEFESTYYGERCDGESLVSMAYTGETFIELIQPLSGRSIFQDYIDKNPSGGIQHIAHSIPVDDLDKAISEMIDKGYRLVTSVNHPIARIVFFDTNKDIGVFTEIMGITKEGEIAVRQMKSSFK
jgi:methylmalonyl-CoA/ethylmalonyl-CoA epimerase